jgi:hypothetical protein
MLQGLQEEVPKEKVLKTGVNQSPSHWAYRKKKKEEEEEEEEEEEKKRPITVYISII